MITPKTNKYTLGRGELHFSTFLGNTQTPAGFRYFGNTPSLGFTAQSQELDHYGMDHGVGELDDSFVTQVTRSGSFATDNIDMDNLALFLFGTKSTNTLTSATAISETLTVLKGMSYQLGMSTGLPAGLRKIANPAISGKVAGTDFTVDNDRGILYIMPTGSIADNASITITYDKTTASYDQVASGSTPLEGALQFFADNPLGENKDFLMPWVRITPNGEFAIKAENALQSLPFNIKILKPSNKAAVYCNGQPY